MSCSMLAPNQLDALLNGRSQLAWTIPEDVATARTAYETDRIGMKIREFADSVIT